MRDVYPIKYYKDEGFIEDKIEIGDEDLAAMIEAYLWSHADFDFDEIELGNNRPMDIWLHAKCRRYLDPEKTKRCKSRMPRCRSTAPMMVTQRVSERTDASGRAH